MAASKGTLHIATADTVLSVEAAPGGPVVLSLASPVGNKWINRSAEKLPGNIFVNGRWEIVQWKLESTLGNPAHTKATSVYESSPRRLRLESIWEARAGAGPIEHLIQIENMESTPVGIPFIASFAFDWAVPFNQRLRHMWIEKGAGTPSPDGTHDVTLPDHYKWEGASSTYARDQADKHWEPIPWMLVMSDEKPNAGWYLGIEFSGRARLTLTREGNSLSGEAGLNPLPGPYLTRVPPSGSFKTPTVFLGAFTGGSDAAGNILRRWVKQTLQNSATIKDSHYPLLVNNSWGSGMAIDEAKARAMAEDSAELGLEMFHMDAGWFRGVADWISNPEKFPHGMGALADHVHQLGLKFGLWVDWTQAGTSSEPGALNVHDPQIRDWLTRDVGDDWKPEPFKGLTIDIGYPPAKAWCGRTLDRLVKDFHLDMLEHDGYLIAAGCTRQDHLHVACDPASLGPPPFLDGSCSTDVSYHATLTYYDLYEKLRRDHPGLLLEACNDGGRMVDFGTAAHVDYFSITDTYDPLSNRRAFYDASHVLPAAMLECYVEKYPVPRLENFLYELRSGMMGWCTIMQDTTTWTPEQHTAAKQAFDLYKTRLRTLIREADLYHISPRPDGVHWDGMEFFDPQTRQGVVYAFRGTTPDEPQHAFVLKGLRLERQYQVEFVGRPLAGRIRTGKALMTTGLDVFIPDPESSEIIFVRDVSSQHGKARAGF